jgi:hypothetical protein
MTRGTALKSVIEYPLGTLGLLLIGLITWATGRLERRALVDRILARLVFAFVSTIGWIVDRWPSRTLVRTSARGQTTQVEPEPVRSFR